MKDWVDVDLDRELERLERETARDDAIERRANELLQHTTDAEFGRLLRLEALTNSTLSDAIYEAIWEIAEREIDTPEDY